MNDLAGPVALALVGLWVAYLVPHKLRHRQQLLESRTEDRFSQALRVVAVSDRPGRWQRLERPAARPTSASAECPPSTATRPLLTPGSGVPARPAGIARAGTATGGTTVERPLGTQERQAAEAARRSAQAHAARAAAVARRRAAARRRAVLAGVLVGATVLGWSVVGLTTVTWVLAAVPTVLLGGVLVLGRRASRSWAAADAEWAARVADEQRVASSRPGTGAVPAARPIPQPLVTGRAVRPSDTDTQVFAAIVTDRGEEVAPVRHATGATPVVRHAAPERPEATQRVEPSGSADAWSPVPVPRPTYTMKASAPRREPAPLGEVEGSTAVRSAADAVAGDEARPALEPPVSTTGGIDLDAVLAKRRAAGE